MTLLDAHYSRITEDINEAKAKLGDGLLQAFFNIYDSRTLQTSSGTMFELVISNIKE